MKKITFIVVVYALVFSLNGQPGRNNQDINVVACLNEKLPPNTNIVYTPTMRAAWTILKDEIVREDIVLTKSLPLIASLNLYPFNVPETEEWLAMGGFVEKGILEEINRKMKNKFGINDTGLDKYTDDEGIICYSYLHKTIRFRNSFETLTWDFPGNDGSRSVECFGVSKGSESEKAGIREQVRIYDYMHRDDFIIRILSGESSKEIILAKIPWSETLSGMIRNIEDRMRLPGVSKLSETDELIIPKIKFDIKHSYDEFLGLYLKNEGFEDYFFAHMAQNISLSLDESGAEAIASGEIVLKKGPGSRLYIFDKPFLVIIRDKNSPEPDMVVWVDNRGLLRAAE
jgi:hypothetical protein